MTTSTDSTKRLNATLAGYQGPFYPACFERLQHAFYAERSSRSRFLNLGSLGRQMQGFVGIGSPTTDDGYDWYFSMNFTRGTKDIAILFPQTQRKVSGIIADRHIAFYMKGEVSSGDDIESLVKEILALYQPS